MNAIGQRRKKNNLDIYDFLRVICQSSIDIWIEVEFFVIGM